MTKENKMNKEKSQAELQIEALADVFNIACEGFEEYYKQAKEKNNGNSSKSAANGDNSQSAANGNYSKSAANGNSSKSAANGNYSKSAANGDYSQSAANGNHSQSAANGNSSKSAANGDHSQSAANGNYSQSAANGYYSQSAANGYYSQSAANGNASKSAANGYSSQSAANGYSSQSAANGYYSQSAANGNYSQSAANGNYSKSAANGDHSACCALGYRAAVKGDKGNLLMASEYVIKDGKHIPVGGRADLVDGKKIRANSWYIVEGGEWVEVDFSDNIFSRVLSNKGGVKKVKTEDGKILFVVSDENGNSAHGKTIKEAREDLAYKVVAKFYGAIPKEATGTEWIGIYRAVTGACSAGVRMFVESTGKSLDETYTAKEIAKLIKGQFGADKFAEKVKELTGASK
jgi:hypothetical protein